MVWTPLPLWTSSFLYRRCASRRCSGRIGPVSPQSSITSRAIIDFTWNHRDGERERLAKSYFENEYLVKGDALIVIERLYNVGYYLSRPSRQQRLCRIQQQQRPSSVSPVGSESSPPAITHSRYVKASHRVSTTSIVGLKAHECHICKQRTQP